MFRRSRRRRSGARLLKTIVVGFCVLLAVSAGINALEAAGGRQLVPYVLGALIVVWLFRRVRGRRPRTTRAPTRLATPRRRTGAGIEYLHTLNPYEFEAYVRDLLAALGYRDLRLNGGAGDLGVDIWGRTPDGQSAAIQCKRYAPGKKIGSPMIQTFIGMQRIHHGADVGVFVTTSGFTADARRLAGAHGIQLIDGAALVQLQRKAGMRQRRRFGVLRRG